MGHKTGKKMSEALLSSALQPEDPQQGSDSSSLMQMNHEVKTIPDGRGILGPAAYPTRIEEPPEGWPKEVHKDHGPKSMAFFWSSSLTLSSSENMARYWPSIGCPFATYSDPLAGQDKRKGTRHSRTAVVNSDAEPANCHELKTLITVVFADYAYKPLGIRLLETI
jgi:hypothetical protein